MKIYLSKSKSCDYEQYLRIKSSFAHKFKCEVVEYTGGTYDPTPMYDCDILFIIPPKRGIEGWCVGKGQYDTIENWKKRKGNKRLWFVTDIEESFPFIELYNVTSGSVINYNWQDHYAIYLKDEFIHIGSSPNFLNFLKSQDLTHIIEIVKPIDETDKFNYDIIL